MSILNAPANLAKPILDPLAAFIKNPFSQSVNQQRPHDFPNGFFIRELVNGSLSTETEINLTGNLMPMQPFEWGGKQRMAINRYPGNPEPAVQVLGGEEGNLVIKGRFKDKRFNPDQIQYGVAYAYSLACQEMRRRGNLLKIGMHGAAGDFIRWAFIERADFKMAKQSWIDYEIEFIIVSENQPVNNFFAADERTAPSAVNQNLINAAAAFAEAYTSVPASMPQSIAGVLNGLISDVAQNVNLVTNFVTTLTSTAQSIEDSANRAMGLVKNARASMSRFCRQADAFTHSFAGLSTQGNAKGRAASTYSNLQFIHESMAGTHQISDYLAKMQAQFEKIARSLPQARYKVQQTDTLQNISVKFYGVSDHWTNIYDHNRLQSSTLVPGTVLEIPHL